MDHLAELRHNAYRQEKDGRRARGRQRKDEDEEMAAAFRHLLATCIGSQHKLIREVKQHNHDLGIAAAELDRGENRLFRAARGYIRNVRKLDPDENVMPRRDARALRHAADCWRVYQNMMEDGPADDDMPQPQCRIAASLPQWEERRRLNENWRKRAAHCYATTQATMIKYKLIRPEEALRLGQAPSIDTSEDNAALVVNVGSQLLQDLASARDELIEARTWLLETLPSINDRDRDMYLRTYEEDYHSDSELEDEKNIDAYTQEYMGRVRAATERVRGPERTWRDLRQRATNERVDDPAEVDLFGVREYPDDGFTDSRGSKMEKEVALNKASQEPTIRKWLKTAHGNGYSHRTMPSVVANSIPGFRSSIRSVGSEGDGIRRHGLIARWNAELVDIRAESEQLLAESRKEDAARAMAWRARKRKRSGTA